MTLRVGLLAGEASGDLLGASLMAGIKAQRSDVEFVGVGGPAMLAQGLDSLAPISEFEVNGFVEPLKRLPRLLALLRRLTDELAEQADVFIGIDFNVFNLLLEKRLKGRGLTTLHYVSPSVYAWRRGRVKTVGRACHRVLTLYPFEPAFYATAGVDARFVGHPMADEIGPDQATAQAKNGARQRLSIAADSQVLAVLPGSRRSEIALMMPAFAEAAARLKSQRPGLRVVFASTSDSHRALVADAVRQFAPSLEADMTIDVGSARVVLTACDLALVKSGTATLEAMLLGKPMVVSYRLGSVSAFLVRPFIRSEFFALPNILAGRALVPELIQADATADKLTAALLQVEEQWQSDDHCARRFAELAQQLRRNAGAQAAAAVLELV
ncbi:MAG: lipid-A-disaccharide synthase [Pseudomonadaceae bacterium]|nr:lipid-A-disaccharide synthase [Pseudomonadaceae bacterium]